MKEQSYYLVLCFCIHTTLASLRQSGQDVEEDMYNIAGLIVTQMGLTGHKEMHL